MEKILLLHGALGNKNDLKKLEVLLSTSYQVFSINFLGHGDDDYNQENLTIEKLGIQVIEWIAQNSIESINIFGYSMGGYVAMYLARYYPNKVKKIVTLGTKLNWNEAEAYQQIRLLNPSKMIEKVPQYVEKLASMYGFEKWKLVVNNTTHLMQELGMNHLSDDDFEHIQHPILLCIGVLDTMVTEEETRHVHSLLANGRLIIIEHTKHAIEDVSIDNLLSTIKSFV